MLFLLMKKPVDYIVTTYLILADIVKMYKLVCVAREEKNMFRIRLVWVALGSLFLLSMAVSGCGEKPAQSEAPAKVVYLTAKTEHITLTSDLPGRVSALVVSEVRPQVEGIILERLFKEGAEVARGQVLYQIDPAKYEAAFNTANAALAEAEANVNALAMLEKRYRGLIKSRSVSQQDLDNATADHGQARARVARAKAELEAAAIDLAYTQIKAPVSGRIGASTVTPGALVTANQSEPLAVIQQTERVYVDITQSSADTLRLRRSMAQGKMRPNGSAAKVRLTMEDGSAYTPVAAVPDEAEPAWILGDLLFAEISVGQSTGSVTLRAMFDNPDGLLLPGMYVTATIEEGALDAVLIPQGCVLSESSGEHFILILREQDSGKGLFKVERRPVTLGRAVANRWIVTSGLEPGDLVVVEGLQKAVDGAAVMGFAREQGSSQAYKGAR